MEQQEKGWHGHLQWCGQWVEAEIDTGDGCGCTATVRGEPMMKRISSIKKEEDVMATAEVNMTMGGFVHRWVVLFIRKRMETVANGSCSKDLAA